LELKRCRLFVLLQVSNGQALNTYLTTIPPFVPPDPGPFNINPKNAQTLVSSAIQWFNGNYSAARQSVQTSIQNATNTGQQQTAAVNAIYPKAQAQIQACLNQQNLSLSAVNSSASK